MSAAEDPVPTIAEVAAAGEQPENLLDQLAAKRAVIAQTKETFIPVPGYDRDPPLLLARYRLLEGPEMQRIGDKVSRETKNTWQRSLLAAMDTMILAIVGFYTDLQEGDEPKPLTLNGAHITGFTSDLAVALKFDGELDDVNSHRSVLMGLFANNDAAISKHNFQLNRWMSDTSIDVSEDFLGNL